LSCIFLGVTGSAESSSEPEISLSYAYYSIGGKTIGELKDQMHDLGPINRVGRHCDAFTDWYVNWSYPYSKDSSGCTTGAVKSTLNVTFRFPQWNQLSGTSKEVADKWNDFNVALQSHEDGHKTIGLEAARKIADALEAIPAQSSCEELERVADTEGNRLLDAAREEEKLYDQKTDHGATQGARLF
jgi:predicted secreted Zn-dependent protease